MKTVVVAMFLFCITLSAQQSPAVPELPALADAAPLPDLPDLPNLLEFPAMPDRSLRQEEMIEETYHFDVENIDRMNVSIEHSLGELTLAANADPNAIDGTIAYYPKRMTPEVDYHPFGTKGKLKIKVKTNKEWKYNHDNEISLHLDDWKDFRNTDEYESEVNFKFPRDIPIDMELDFGLGDGKIDLSQLSVSDFNLECGLSDVKVIMKTPNPERCRSVTIETGLGDLNAYNLGNLRANRFNLRVGLGSADLDLTGDHLEDMEGEIEVGLGSLDLTLPKYTNIKLEIEQSFLSSVDVDDLVKRDDFWLSPDWDEDRPTIELEISVGLGSVGVGVRK